MESNDVKASNPTIPNVVIRILALNVILLGLKTLVSTGLTGCLLNLYDDKLGRFDRGDSDHDIDDA